MFYYYSLFTDKGTEAQRRNNIALCLIKYTISEAKLPGFKSCLPSFLAVMLYNLLHAVGPQFPHLKNRGNNSNLPHRVE